LGKRFISAGNCVPLFEGEVIMVWALVRISIFMTAFFIGTTFVGSGDPFSSAASPEASAIPQLDQKIGTSLVVACDAGSVSIKHLDVRGAVQFDCSSSNMVVVRDHNEFSKKIPDFRLLRHQVNF
jgi:hypothetical protein